MAKVGRPRTSVPEHDELIELGKDLVAWASDDSKEAKKEKRWRFCDWYAIKHGFVKKQWEHMQEKPEFRGYYEQARAFLGLNYMDGTINPSIAHRFLRKYIDDVKDEENEEAAYKASLTKQAEMNPDDFRKQLLAVVQDGQTVSRAHESGKSDVASK